MIRRERNSPEHGRLAELADLDDDRPELERRSTGDAYLDGYNWGQRRSRQLQLSEVHGFGDAGHCDLHDEH